MIIARSCTATVDGVPVGVHKDSGRITLDAGSAPHVTGDLVVSIPADASILDPRDTPAPRVLVTVHDGPRVRTFDLHVRERSVSHGGASASLKLASDEALLGDYAPLADDTTPRLHEASARGVVDYVLHKAIPGAALAALPATDADLTAYWSVTNLLANPSAEGALAPWTGGGNCTLFGSGYSVPGAGVASAGFTASGAGLLAVVPHVPNSGPNVTPGKSYVFSGYGRQYQTSPARTIRACVRWLNAAGVPVGPDVEGAGVPMTDTGFAARPFVIATAPPGASKAEVFWRVAGSTAAGQIGYIDAAMFYEGNELIGYFDGSTPANAHYTYAWAGGAHASASTRTPVVERSPDSLVWRAGQSALDFLGPLVQSAGFRLVCDEHRTWTLRDEHYTSSGSLSLREGVNLVSADDTISRDGAYWFDAQVTRYKWTDRDGIQQERVDAYARTTPHSRLNTVEVAAAYPGPGRSEYAVRRAQGIGREVTVETMADWTAAAEKPLRAVLVGAPPLYGVTARVEFDIAGDRMTVTTRTRDVSPHAWILQEEHPWTSGPVGQSWKEAP